MSRARALLASVSAVCALTLVSGCGPTMADLPLPGGGVSGDTVDRERRVQRRPQPDDWCLP